MSPKGLNGYPIPSDELCGLDPTHVTMIKHMKSVFDIDMDEGKGSELSDFNFV